VTYLAPRDAVHRMHAMSGARARYSVTKLIEQHGQRGNLSKWVSGLRGRLPETECRSTARALRPYLT